jgi:hypothetical protein
MSFVYEERNRNSVTGGEMSLSLFGSAQREMTGVACVPPVLPAEGFLEDLQATFLNNEFRLLAFMDCVLQQLKAASFIRVVIVLLLLPKPSKRLVAITVSGSFIT